MATRASKDDEDHLVSGIEQYPFDFYNNLAFYDPKPEKGSDYTRLLEAQTDLAQAIITAATRGLKFKLVVGSMSNGYLAYKLAEDNADKIRQSVREQYGEEYLTTQRMKHRVAAEEMLNQAVLPNQLQNHNISNQVERNFPDSAVFSVAGFEAPIRAAKGNNAMSQGASFQDWTFERWWLRLLVTLSSGMILEGDHAYSRYKNPEGSTADQIQCGLLDHLRKKAGVGPGKEYDVTDAQGNHVPLADRAWEIAKHIIDVVERGFRTDFAVASLAISFQLDDWLRDTTGESPIDRSKVHPILANRTAEELARMDRLKEIMLPYIAEKCARWTPYQAHGGLNKYFEENIIPLSDNDTVTPEKIAAVKEELFAYIPRGGFINPDYYTGKEARPAGGLSAAFSSSVRPVKPTSTDDSSFNSARIFDDYHFDKLDVWEQSALDFAVAVATKTFVLPDNAPRKVFYACEPKGGVSAKEYADKKGIKWLKEAQSADDPVSKKSNFVRDVIKRNIRRDSLVHNTLANEDALRSRQVQNVVSTLDILKIDEAIQKFRHGIAAKGPERLSARARLALEMEIMDRSVEVLVLRKGWQYHPADVQMALHAVLIAIGQVERSYEGGNYRMEILEHDQDAPKDRLQKLDLHALVQTLGEFVESELDSIPAVPDRETYLAMARLLEITDKLIDPGRKNFELVRDPMKGKVTKTGNEIIKWRHVDADLTSFMYNAPDKVTDLTATRNGAEEESLRDRLRRKLLDVGVLEFNREDLKDLDIEYTNKWYQVHGQEAAQGLDENTLRRTRYVKHEGPA